MLISCQAVLPTHKLQQLLYRVWYCSRETLYFRLELFSLFKASVRGSSLNYKLIIHCSMCGHNSIWSHMQCLKKGYHYNKSNPNGSDTSVNFAIKTNFAINCVVLPKVLRFLHSFRFVVLLKTGDGSVCTFSVHTSLVQF